MKKKTTSQKKRIIYPKVDGETFDILRRRRFDEFRESFEWVIKEQIENGAVSELTRLDMTTIAWNCAYIAVTDNS